MHVLRLACGLAMAVLLVGVWQHRDLVTDAYTEEREPIEFAFDGITLESSDRVDLGTSPLLRPRAVDTSDAVLAPLVEPASPSRPSGVLPRGSVDLGGLVTGPDGAVPGATVVLEHHDLGGVVSLSILTDETGTWGVGSVAGGRWRIRAHVPGMLASQSSAVFFAEAGEQRTIDLGVVGPSEVDFLDSLGPDSLFVGDSATVAVALSHEQVTEDGRLGVVGRPDVAIGAELNPGSALSIVSATVATTNGEGSVAFVVRCDTSGSSSGRAIVGDVEVDLDLPLCLTPPPPTLPPTTAPPVTDPPGTPAEADDG